jgi:ParB-like chromosome segregation protein Spo0J
VNADSIKVGTRYRKDMGSIDKLASSIRDVGLIQPIVVDGSGNLIAGERRLAACRLLGMADVPVAVVGGLDDAAQVLRAERDENTCRKDMTPSELIALGKALEELERPKARERQENANPEGIQTPAAHANSSPPKRDASGYTRNIVSDAVGMSGATYQRAKHVVETAAKHTDPVVRKVAQHAQDEMDATGRVGPAYDKVRRAEREAEVPAAEDTSDRVRRPRLHRRQAASILPAILGQINGIAAAAQGVDFSGCRIEPSEFSQLDAGVRAILAIRKTLKECTT